uniref:Uncharacterized protein n=1 Tax=Anguilla anguilla TaxID=7936 RepID=A0A0E9Q3S7_ANGAN
MSKGWSDIPPTKTFKRAL